MAWVESNQEIGRHPKAKKLARLLGKNLPETVGTLHYLWWWALDFAQDGNLSKYEPADIADAVLWDGDPDALLEALKASGFIDDDDGVPRIHDWSEYTGRLFEQRAANAARMREARAKKARTKQERDGESVECAENDNETCSARSRTVQERKGATVHDSTVPNLTEQNMTEPERTGQEPDSTEPDDGKPSEALQPCPFEKIKELFNSLCISYSKLRSIDGARRTAVAARWKQYKSLGAFTELFEKAEASSFLKGVNDRNWTATFDWLMKANNMAKVLEDQYIDKGTRPQQKSQNGKPDTLGALARIIADEEGGSSDD